jgi:hypothetical protein
MRYLNRHYRAVEGDACCHALACHCREIACATLEVVGLRYHCCHYRCYHHHCYYHYAPLAIPLPLPYYVVAALTIPLKGTH